MNLKEILRGLKNSKSFKEWRIKEPESYLCSCFKNNNEDWQFSFYSPKKDRITIFLNNKILQEDSKIFRKEKTKINELKLGDIKTNLNQILKILKEKHSQEKINKTIIILQNLDIPIWNITCLISLNILNIKIDAITGKIISEKLSSVVEFKTK